MTTAIKINANDGRTRNVMTGGETTVDFDFPIFDDDHVKLIETATDGTVTELVKDTDFTVPAGSVNQQAGGTLNLDATQYPSGATAGHVFTALLNVPYSRTTDFNDAGDFFADTLNKELDLITQQIQQFIRDLARAPLAPEDTTLTALSLPDPIDGYGIVWDGVAGALRNTTSSLAILEGNAATVAGDITNVNTVATNIASVNTVAGISSDVTTVAGIASDVTDAANNIPKSNRTATTNPTVDDDVDEGYSEGSVWVNTTTDVIYFCTDATDGAAVWLTTDATIADGAVTTDKLADDAVTTEKINDGAVTYAKIASAAETSILTTNKTTANEYTKTQNFEKTTLTDAASISWDASSNQVCSVTLGGNRTLSNPTNLVDGATYILIVKQDATGGRTLSYGSNFKWAGGTAPTLSTAANAVDVLTFVCDGTDLYGVFQGDFQ